MSGRLVNLLSLLLATGILIVVAYGVQQFESKSEAPEIVFIGSPKAIYLYTTNPEWIEEQQFNGVKYLSSYSGALLDYAKNSNSCGIQETVFNNEEAITGIYSKEYSIFTTIGEFCEPFIFPRRTLIYAKSDGSNYNFLSSYNFVKNANGKEFISEKINQKVLGHDLEKLRKKLPMPIYYKKVADAWPLNLKWGLENGIYLVKDDKIFLVNGIFLEDLKQKLQPQF